MAATDPQSLIIDVDDTRRVSGLLQAPDDARACYVVAHGAGAGMEHPFMKTVAIELAERQVATLRYQFPYMERGSRRPDSPKLAQAAVRAAVTTAALLLPGLPLVAGGKSYGGRMTSEAQAEAPLPGVGGLVFLGFPLHPPGKPSTQRAGHLENVQVPMLFLQGTRDAFADLELLESVVDALGERATLNLLDDADHSFHVPKRAGRRDGDVQRDMLDAMAAWLDGLT